MSNEWDGAQISSGRELDVGAEVTSVFKETNCCSRGHSPSIGQENPS